MLWYKSSKQNVNTSQTFIAVVDILQTGVINTSHETKGFKNSAHVSLIHTLLRSLGLRQCR